MRPHQLTGPMWVLRGGDVLATAEVAHSLPARLRGVAGSAGFEGALFLPRAPLAHSLAARFPVDVAFLDAELRVVDTVHLVPWRMARPRLRCPWVLQAEGGAFERWRLQRGDELELRGTQ